MSWADRWAALIECKVCNVQFELEHPDPAPVLVPGTDRRLVLIGCPDECPQCAAKERGAKVVDIRCRRPAR